MNSLRFKSGVAVLIVLACSALAHAQSTVAVGLYPLGSYSGGPFDTINNGNLNAHFSIPVVSKRGPSLPFQYSLSYDSSVWYPVTVSGTTTWTPVNAKDWGWSAVGENTGVGGYVSYMSASYSCLVNPGNPHPVYFNWYDSLDFVYHDSQGGSHPFGIAVTTFPPSGAPCGSDSNHNTAAGVASDHSGFSISVNSTPSGTITDRSGVTFNLPFFSGTPSSSTASEVNPDGNTISTSVAGQTTAYTDALSMTALTAAATGSPITKETYSYSAFGNVQAQVVVKYAPYTVKTNFGCTSPRINEFGPTSENLVYEIDMPDIATNSSDKYTFTYETTPGYSGDTTGRLASVTLPTGGTISYAYSGGNNGIQCSDGSTAGLTRTLSPGGAWSYTRTDVSGSEWKTALSDPNSNVTTMYFQVVTSGGTASLAYETERDLPGASGTILTCYNGQPSPCTNASDTTAVSLPITRQTVMNTFGSDTSEVDTWFDTNGYGLPTEVKQYDWSTSSPPTTLLLDTVTAYDYNTSCGIPTGSSIVDQPCTVTVNGNNSQAQWTNGLSSTSNTYDSKGNLLSSASGGLTKGFTYNSNGTVATATDVNSQVTTYAYNGTGGCSSAYPTSVTGPAPSSLVVSVQWDCYAGVPKSVTDPNSRQTTYSYDNMNRLTSTGYPDGGLVTTTYSSTQIQTTTKITSSISRTDTTNLDGMGRVSSQIVAGAETDSTYDSFGRLSTVSVLNSGQQDTYAYDSLSRVNKVTHADSSNSQISYPNNCATITDESGKVRQLCSDGVGRTSQVIEDPSGLNYTTTYAYDGLNDLIGVAQGSQQACQIGSTSYSRCFQYDSLGRMTQATTPESGMVTYTYDSDSICGTSTGDLVKRVDARSIRTCHSYDSIHRLTSNTYTDGTPTANFYYDQSSYNGLTITNGLGKQTGMSDGSGATAWTFDPIGRPLTEQKTISGTTKTISYGYNYDGSVASLTYPSGRMITYAVDSLGRPATAVDSANSINYVTGTCTGSAACYAPQNALSSIVAGKTGSFGGITYSLGYNNRLLPSSISASSTSGTALSLAYSYFSNANVQTVTNYRDSGRTTTYGYDSLNRVNSGSSQATSGADCWGQSVPSTGYDRFSNLLTINVTKCSAPSLSLGVNAKNQVTNSGFGYDASGDETGDGSTTYAWDAEGRMKSAGSVNYTFDGSGERVQDSSPKLYWYGQDGTVLAETDTSGNAVNEYVFFDGMRIARRDGSGNVYYYFGISPLGSTAITNASGAICYDADFYPFGGEIAFTNTCAQNYKFAEMERDSPSGLDRTIFRQYSSNYGRWLSPDPYYGSYDLTNPQSLNRYAYVLNNSTNFVDFLGLDTGYYWANGCLYSFQYSDSYSNGNDTVTAGADTLEFCYGQSGPSSCPQGVSCGPTPGTNGGGGGGGGGGAPSNGQSYSFVKQWWKDLTNCVGNYAVPTIVDDLNPFSTNGVSGVAGLGAAASASLSQHFFDQTGLYIVSKGLTVPLRSSTVRGGLSLANKFGKLSGILGMIGIDYALADAAYAEYKGCYATN